jgi:hypothetical protein
MKNCKHLLLVEPEYLPGKSFCDSCGDLVNTVKINNDYLRVSYNSDKEELTISHIVSDSGWKIVANASGKFHVFEVQMDQDDHWEATCPTIVEAMAIVSKWS